jgi:hypothetical protein
MTSKLTKITQAIYKELQGFDNNQEHQWQRAQQLAEAVLRAEQAAQTEAGSVDVDSGSIWIGDPCYVMQDDESMRSSDLGESWGELTSIYHDRSGETKYQLEWFHWDRARDDYLFNHPKWLKYLNEYKGHPDSHKRGTEVNTIKEAVIQEAYAEYEVSNPFTPITKPAQFACFGHRPGEAGLGIMMNTAYGDGTYPVFVEYNSENKIAQATIVFDCEYAGINEGEL